jgi:hypothetical protein
MKPDGEEERTNNEANHSYWLQLMKRTSQVSRRISQSIQRTLNQRENLDGIDGDRVRGREAKERGDGRRGPDNDSLQYSSIE